MKTAEQIVAAGGQTVDIVGCLHDYFVASDRYKDARLELSRIAVALGQDQRQSVSGNGAIDYLDGLIAGRGSLPVPRRS